MTNLAEAVTADREGRVEEAASLYEAALVDRPGDLDIFIDLIALYWQVTDYGFWTGHGLSREFVRTAERRLAELIAAAKARFPGRPEVWFWSEYIAWADLGRPLDPAECRTVLNRHPTYLEPAMFLYSVSEGRECEAQALALLAAASGTTRDRYVSSVIRAVRPARQ